MTKKLSIFRGRIKFQFCDGIIRTLERRNKSLKIGPKKWYKSSLANRRKFFRENQKSRRT